MYELYFLKIRLKSNQKEKKLIIILVNLAYTSVFFDSVIKIKHLEYFLKIFLVDEIFYIKIKDKNKQHKYVL